MKKIKLERQVYHPLYQKMMPIQFVLSSLASQEGCDGDPYDTMQEAAEYIDFLEELIEERLNKERE